MDIISVATIGFRSLLLLDTALANTVKSPAGNFKIFKSVADGDFNSPYILMAKLYGGEDNNNPQRSFDMIFRISAVSKDQTQAEELAGRIEAALVGSWPVLRDWKAWAAITQVAPYNEQRIVQNIPHFEAGAQYRIRAVKDKE
jgi:hypothetical protein